MQIKITEEGWAGYTGSAGGVEFVDGVSVHDVSNLDAQRLANNIRCEMLDGRNPSTAQRIIDTDAMTLEQMQALTPVVPEPEAPAKVWTREELSVIADEGGITSIRKITDPMGLKSNSIAKLIDMLVNGPDAPEVPEVPEVPAAPAEAPAAA